jgi:hypothetical protein
MGGLLERLYAGGYGGIRYKREYNLKAGDIHKLITLDKPHYLSELTNELIDAGGQNQTAVGAGFARVLGCMTCGAVADLRPGSEPLSNMPEVPVPAHAIIGVGGILALQVGDAITADPLTPVGALVRGVALWSDSEFACVFGGLRHDVIVTAPSQVGGMTAGAVTAFDAQPSLENPLWWGVHFTVTKELRVSKRVIELLNASVRSDLFGQFRATSPRGPVGEPCQGR